MCCVIVDLGHLVPDLHLPQCHFYFLDVHEVVEGCCLHHVEFFFFFLIVCFTSYFVFSIVVLPHSPGVVYYHLLLRRETRIPGITPFSFRIGIWDLFVHRGQKSYTPTAFGKLWTTPGVRCTKHASSLSMTPV